MIEYSFAERKKMLIEFLSLCTEDEFSTIGDIHELMDALTLIKDTREKFIINKAVDELGRYINVGHPLDLEISAPAWDKNEYKERSHGTENGTALPWNFRV